MTAPADELRAAAATLHSLTADATQGPWSSEDPNTNWGDDHDNRLIGRGKILATFNSEHNGPLNSDYTAAMHPGVGAALADWLAKLADFCDGVERTHGKQPPADNLSIVDALAVAREINKEGQP